MARSAYSLGKKPVGQPVIARSFFCDEAIPSMVEIASHKPLAMTQPDLVS